MAKEGTDCKSAPAGLTTLAQTVPHFNRELANLRQRREQNFRVVKLISIHMQLQAGCFILASLRPPFFLQQKKGGKKCRRLHENC
ncbi:hypothetical protein [uncultured Draconibacterium sp.]|uniref:hypothetical protein n=1 Tax=uncultured Draconibacterium sp. TaxID=1573823 RepID=UPI00326058AE